MSVVVSDTLVPRVAAGAGLGPAMPSVVWRRLAYVYATLVVVGIGYFLFRMPFQLRDNLGLMVDAQQRTLWNILTEVDPGYVRPVLGGFVKIVFELSGGHYFLAYKTLHAIQVGLLLVLFVRLLDVRSSRDFAVSTLATTILVGIHTFNGTIREGFPINTFMTILVCCLTAVNLSMSRPRPWVGWASVFLLVWAVFTVETGLLVWVCFIVAYVVGFRGLSKRVLIALTVVIGVYFLLRFVIMGAGTPALGYRQTGFGFSNRDPEQLLELFGEVPLLLYAYNIASSILSVLFSEPRAGIWAASRSFLDGDLRDWQTVNIVSSFLATAVIGRFVWRRWRRWVAFDLEHGDRLVLLFLAVLGGNAVISYPYTKDVIMSPAGVFYALAAYVAIRDFLESAQRRTFYPVRAVSIALLLAVMSVTWCIRSVGNHYSLRSQAFLNSSDWTELDSWLQGRMDERQEPDAVALSKHLGDEVARKRVPNPYFGDRAAPGVIALFDPH